MASTGEDDEYSLQAKITVQASKIRQMKKDSAAAADVTAEVTLLTSMRAKLVTLLEANKDESDLLNRKAFDELLLRKMYVVQSFEIHNGPAGFFDYGPPACALKANVLSAWTRHFVQEEAMLQMECTNLTPSVVLETSGHVERFTDFMVRDEVTGDCFRADKLLEDAIDDFLADKANADLTVEEKEEHLKVQRQADAYTADELDQKLKEYKVMSQTNKDNKLTFPFPFNLMFKTTIGPEGNQVGFLRPETAQGLFVNFRRLLDFNQGRMPFAAAQIGLGFRNEIAPRNGLLRVREFCMAEIEHFVNPSDKSHSKFFKIADKELILFPQDAQLGTGRTIQITAGEAVKQKIIDNETLAYFVTRTQLWLEKIGVDPTRLRFRQHLRTEMAHYATDCWDAEIKVCHGWVECVGHADRSCYDLECHSAKTGVPLVASQRLDEPILVDKMVAEANKKLVGPRFKGDQKQVLAAIEALDGAALEAFKADIDSKGKATIQGGFEITSDLITFKNEKKHIHESKYLPGVIEPSFGIGRIMYAVLEHAFTQRDGDENRCVMRFKPNVAPIKIGIYPLLNNDAFGPIVSDIQELFLSTGVANKVDTTSGTVGRRYARADELGIPFGITIDFQTLIDDTVTLRERDSMEQIRLPISSLVNVINILVQELQSWNEVASKYPTVDSGDDNKSSSSGNNKSITREVTSRASFSRPAQKLVQ